MVEGVGLEPTNPMGADLQSAAFGQLRYPSIVMKKTFNGALTAHGRFPTGSLFDVAGKLSMVHFAVLLSFPSFEDYSTQ